MLPEEYVQGYVEDSHGDQPEVMVGRKEVKDSAQEHHYGEIENSVCESFFVRNLESFVQQDFGDKSHPGPEAEHEYLGEEVCYRIWLHNKISNQEPLYYKQTRKAEGEVKGQVLVEPALDF